MMKIVMVGLGGFVGAALRFLIGGAVHRLFKFSWFPMGTMVVNLIGCLFIGVFLQLDELRNVFSIEARLFLFVGIFGALTTFSTFGNDTIHLFKNEKFYLALLNVGSHMILGLVAVWLGHFMGSFFAK